MTTEPSLRSAYQNDFPIGAAVNPATLESHRELLARHFASVTAENEMKPMHLQPREGEFDFSKADRLVAFAKEHHMKVRGHTLVWHHQTPDWFFEGRDGMPVNRDTALGRMKDHITAVLQHFKGDVYCWDVVNEAIDDHNETVLRKAPWLDIVGEDYLLKAFTLAHEADPSAQLFYNDYNEWNPEKRGKICRLVRDLLAQGAPIHGLGLQGHWSIHSPTADEVRETIDIYAELGLKLQVTELDVSLYAPGDRREDAIAPDREIMEKQAAYYDAIFKLFKEYRGIITGVTLWGVADDATWLDGFPVRGRKNHPLLFDVNHGPKEAFYRVLKA